MTQAERDLLLAVAQWILTREAEDGCHTDAVSPVAEAFRIMEREAENEKTA